MGHIKLDRKILEWEWYTDINTCRLFLHMLLKANWKDGKFQGVEVPRGSFVASYQTLADESGLTERGVRTALSHLKTTGEVTVKRHAKFSVITVNNYCMYQSSDTVIDNQVTVERQSSDSQVTTIEEEKKERREEKDNTSSAFPQKPDAEAHIFATIRELYNSVCGSYPRLVKMSEARKKAIRARMNCGYEVLDFEILFQKAEQSDFLKGKNNRNWTATFDWLITDSNMAKVLDGNYDNRQQKQANDVAERWLERRSNDGQGIRNISEVN